jgi:hypothetical protein
MDMNEFNSKAVRTEDSGNVYFEVRAFGDAQGDAIDSYLHDALASVEGGFSTFGDRTVVLLCDATANIPPTANNWLQHLEAAGVAVEIRPQ